MNKNVFLRDYTEKIYDIEQKREESLLTQSGRMSTVQGLVLTIISLILSNANAGNVLSFADFKWIILSIIVSLLLSFLVQIRIPMRSYPKIGSIEEIINENSDKSDILEDEVNEFYLEKTKDNNSWLTIINQIRSALITLSSIAFIVGIVLLVIKLFEVL